MKKLILIALVCSAALYSSASGYFGIKPIVTEPNCYGDNTASIQLSLVGGQGPFNYSWSGGLPSSIVQNNLAAGSYAVTVTDANNLTASYTIIIAQPYAMQINETHNAPQTHGASNGSIAVSVDGGSPGYTYLWSTGETTENLSNLPAGTYTLTVTDAVGCQATVSQTLTQPSAPFFVGQSSQQGDARSMNSSDITDPKNGTQASNSNQLSNRNELKSSDVQVYPNPAVNTVTLKTGDVNNALVSVIDANGRVVSQQNSTSNQTNVNVSNLPKGDYIIEVRTEDGNTVSKTVTVVK